jgi:hypothetical protein
MASEQQSMTEASADVTGSVLANAIVARPLTRPLNGQRRKTAATKNRPCDQQNHRAHVVSQELFRGALARERKCADRSDQPFVLVLVGPVGASNPSLDPALW